MDAPPPQEDCRPFVKIAKLLAEGGLHVPKVWAADLSRGFLTLSDLGRQTWLEVLNQDNADQLFSLAIDALIRMQRISVHNAQLPEYDEALLRELQLFQTGMLRMCWVDLLLLSSKTGGTHVRCLGEQCASAS